MTEQQAIEGIEWATRELAALRAKVASLEAAQSASNSPTTNVEVSEPPLKREGFYHAGGGHAPASGSRDGSETLAPAMEATSIPAAPDDVERLKGENAELRKERDALLQEPIDHAKMDSIDDGGDTPTLMTAYYWWKQAKEARAALSAIPMTATGEVEAWRQCALYDATMAGPIFKGWDRSAMDRCRRRYIEADALTDHTPKDDE